MTDCKVIENFHDLNQTQLTKPFSINNKWKCVSSMIGILQLIEDGFFELNKEYYVTKNAKCLYENHIADFNYYIIKLNSFYYDASDELNSALFFHCEEYSILGEFDGIDCFNCSIKEYKITNNFFQTNDFNQLHKKIICFKRID